MKKMEKKVMYRTSKWSIVIELLEVVKSTEKTVTYLRPIFMLDGPTSFKEERESRITNSGMWHDSFEDAKEHLIKREKRALESLKSRLAEHEKNISILTLLTP